MTHEEIGELLDDLAETRGTLQEFERNNKPLHLKVGTLIRLFEAAEFLLQEHLRRGTNP